MRLEVRRRVGAVALSFGALGAAGCDTQDTQRTAEYGAPLVCPPGAAVQRVGFSEARGAGYAQRCVLSGGEIRHGPSREFDAEGRLRGVTHWWQGLLHGETIFWHANGQPANRAAHYRRQPVGVWTGWDARGEVTDQRDFGAPDLSQGSWPIPELGLPPDALPEALESEPPAGQLPPGEGAQPTEAGTVHRGSG